MMAFFTSFFFRTRNRFTLVHASAKEEGREEGHHEEKLSIAKAMLAENLPIMLIAKITGLSIVEIQQLEQ